MLAGAHSPDNGFSPRPVLGDAMVEQPIGPRRRRRVLFATFALMFVLAAYPAWTAMGIWRDWRGMERAALDSDAYDKLPPVQPPATVPGADGQSLGEGEFATAPLTAADSDAYQTFMIVGMDESKLRADVIILALLPYDGSPPILVSIPRDLYIPNRCTQDLTRVNANFNGCGDINGPTALSGAIKDFTGYKVDHFALFTFEGFATIIDQIGGIELCVDRPTREEGRFELPTGCTQADGATALGWVRSRKTQEFVDGRWQRMFNVSDLTRNQRQQDVIIGLFERVSGYSSPNELDNLVSSMADTFVLDDGLGLGEAVDLIWNNRNLDADTFIRPKIPVADHVTSYGAQVLIPTEPFDVTLAKAKGE